MAEFKLGRIRFVWKGVWAATTQYYVDDVVKHGGQVYICTVGHIAASDFNTDLEASTTRWNLMSGGQDWKGSWVTGTLYKLNDIVKYGGSVYLCIDSHTSAATESLGLEQDLAKWQTFAEGFDWKGDWAISTRYKINDLVKYGGYTYVCNTGHTSAGTTALGLEDNQSSWDSFNEGIVYKGDWSTTTRYKINDVVKYGPGLWICTTKHTSTSSFDTGSFAQFVEGFEFESTWSGATTYQPGDVVNYGGYQYVAKTVHSNVTPTDETNGATNWDLYSKGFSFQNDWSNATSYKVGEVVRLNGYTYVAALDSPTETYTITASNAGAQTFTVGDTTDLVAGKSIRFTGSTFGNVDLGATYYVKTIASPTTFTISTTPGGTTFTPTTASGSMTGTVAAFPTNATYWTRLNSGIRWQGAWVDDTEYVLGDAVSHSGNTYICILGHRSEGDDGSTIGAQGGGAANSRPDRDTTGTYWNALTLGSEVNILTTAGDMIYYSGSGPARLPIGTTGQVLQVGTDGYPEWAHLWGNAHIYYVAPHGVDAAYPVNGGTLQNPWASIRYACQQVEKGCLNPNAKYLLEMNRSFIQKEVTEWIQYQITNNLTPFTSSFDYDEHKCERDVGFMIDRLVWDITHGGNLKTRAAAQTYVNALSDGPYSTEEFGTGQYTKLSTEGTKDIAAFNYMETVIGFVLSNTAPTVNYQVLNADNSTAVVSQFIDLDYTAEAGVTTTIAGLIDIVTNTLSAGDASAIPERDNPANSIYVKTGTYYETLPIIVPAETAIIGDEVRSVHVLPSSGTIPSEDSYYTVKSLDRLASIIESIPTGAAVTASTGNNETQTLEWPLANSTTAEALSSKVRAMKYNVDFRLGTINSFSYPDPTDYNTAYLSGYGDARTLILANKEFFKAQVEAYLTANYTELFYSRTSCKRDVGYITDALVYDLTYGGNVMSCQAGLAYYQGTGSSLYIDSTERTATLAAYAYLKTMFQAAAANTTITSLQSNETQVKNLSLTGGSAASTFIGNNIDEMIDIVTNGPSAETRTNPSTSWVASALTTASSTLSSATATIQSNTISWINSNYPDLDYNETKCSRDVGYVLDAVRYDFMFNGNFQTLKAAYAYLRATASEVYTLGQKAATRAAWEYVRTQAIANVGGNTTAIARINALFEAIDDIIYSGSNEGDVCQSEDRMVDYAITQLERNRNFIVQEIDAWMNYNYVNFDDYYNSSTCARDIGYIIDAVISDLATGSNFASSVAGESYYRIQAALVPGAQMMQTVAAVKEAKRLASAYVTDSSLYSAVNAAFDNVVTILEGGLTAVPTYTWPDNGTSTTGAGGTVTDAALLQTNRATLISGIETYLSTTPPYSTVWAGLTLAQQNACKRDVGYIIDAVTYDLQYGGTMQTTIAGSAYYSFGTLEIATSEKAATLAALTQLSTLMQAYTSSTNDATVNTKVLVVYNIINNGATEPMTYTMPSVAGESAAKQATHAAIGTTNKATIKSSVTSYITTTFSTYSYNTTLCNRDTNEIIDALIWDLKYSSNYRTLYCSRYYANAVIGSLEEDMFYLRNGTGLRNMTLEGLSGDLTPENEWGTRRVTAGAYASLDPGWGPDDFRTWILNRSPYVQNCCTFGTAAIGQKIDGNLHTGGNKSIVSNDFTQLISDGIGAWVTNNGRAELVSVFTYYSHIGYLSENGGRIRGTNGNNSYGDFGSVAEGYDSTETPNTAVIDNKAFKASVGLVFTDSSDDIYGFEFDNAGSDYSEVVWAISGAGLGAVAEQDEFRDDAVFNVRLLDNVDDSTSAPEAEGNFGGYGYVTNSNTAQTGSSTSITIAATDAEISSAYIGMKIYLTGGTGVGQYGIITTYNAGSKVAGVIKESTGLAGWDHIVPGTTIVSPDASTTYTIEPRLAFTSPSFTSATATLPTSGTWTAVRYGDTSATYTSLTGTYSGTSTTNATWNVQRNGSKYFVTNATAGSGYTRLETITIAGTSLGGLSTTNDLVITITAVNSVTGAIQAWETEGHGLGGRYVAVRSGTAVGATSEDGITWTTRTSLMPTTANWSAMAAGMFDDNSTNEKISRFVVVATGSTSSAYSADGITWTGMSLPVSANWSDITFGEGRFVAVANNSTTVAISNDGENWDVTGTLPATGFNSVTYGMGLYVAVRSGTTSAAYSTDGVTWTSGTLPAASAWNSVQWGNGKFVAVATDSNSGAISLDGVNWVAVTLGSVDGSSAAGYQKVGYGQGLFMATTYQSGSQDYSYVATSEDGVNWTARGVAGVPNATTGYNAIAFGNPQRTGRWVVLGKDSGTQAVYIRAGATAKARAFVSEQKIYAIRLLEPGSGYDTAPTMTITDPNNTYEAPFTVRIGKGALGNPSFKNRGTGFSSASAEIDTGDGYADYYQDGAYIAVKRLTERPVPGSNVTFGHLPGETFKLVNVLTFLGSYDGSYTCFFQISPLMKKISAPEQHQTVTTRIRYSQVRLTGHDFLNIGFGNFEDSNYPNEPLPGYALTQANETMESNGGRVFFTSTDQDGNFRVGDLFTIEQSTGVATLNADAFNIAGLQELSLGEVTLGGGSATITEFSTDPYFTANSDNVIPTQRAIKAYISSQIGGGGASLNVNSVTAGSIYIATNYITTIGSSYITISAKTNFTGGVTGTPLAFNYFIL